MLCHTLRKKCIALPGSVEVLNKNLKHWHETSRMLTINHSVTFYWHDQQLHSFKPSPTACTTTLVSIENTLHTTLTYFS